MSRKCLMYVSSFLFISFLLICYVAKNFEVFQTFCVTIISLIISWNVSNFINNRILISRVSPKNRAILITGCDSGFGHQLAIETHKLGFYVFAGVLLPDGVGAQNLKSICSDKMKVLKMDVTNFDDVSNVMNEIKSSGVQLWAVVNNAGIIIGAPIEWGHDINELSKTFSVNVFGTVRVTKLSIPLLRLSNGRIINVASVVGRITVPEMSTYCMSKHAIRSFSDGLRRELNQFKIKVVSIEPTMYKTPMADWNSIKNNIDHVWNQTSKEVQSQYSEKWRKCYIQRTQALFELSRKQINEVVDAMINAITLEEPKINYKCGGLKDYISTFAFSYFPESIQDFLWNIFIKLG